MSNNSATIEKTLGLGENPAPKKWKKIFIVLFILLAIAAAVLYGIKKNKKDEVSYITVAYKTQDLTTTVSATGNLEPTNTVDVGIEVSGTISEVLVDYNDRVHVNQPMARLDTTKLMAVETSSKSNWMKFQANEQSAKATLDNAVIENDRVQKMYASTQGNYPSRKDMQSALTALEQAKAGLAAAKAQVAQSLAQLKTDQDNLKKAVVVSPIEGIVLSRKVEPGQTVVASMQTPVLFTLAEDLTKMKAIVSVDEADIGGVKENQEVQFSVDAYPNRVFEGKITQLRMNSEIVNGVVTYEAVVEVQNNDLLLRPGMTANASIITGLYKNVPVVPNAALRFTPPITKKDDKKKHATNGEDKGNYVWILKNKTPVKTKVVIGQSNGIMSIVKSSSLKIGDQIITGVEE
ncbi:MAG: efflux RND transporter periplasmic adaptor subunit [Sulfuricurvum sp.]|uniref:efflux RND transporter periplasmic adaptor subunit n=1 Tax=Sulfuricurvum sp. TaxID=2025608 RepID=UPI00261930DE|nr:efflux RND transporter periplasmic adaptor subunit [Sulfuricurvum sp.]MDD2369566.1 efflux RND transporter periplasmic adaptor subunit [Sulfuricurvum sp.]MDD2950161.1 efflux RND transporter periplasmic adaptor subunit [Sulfuricurvum sp.]MDD5118473.1 efflux RND transporter periplasmic adaptor subunit [Sulfuricurvum sp.]